MGFKESFQEDLKNTFFDPEELASEHFIDGKNVVIILQQISLEAAKSKLNPKESSVNKKSYVIYIMESEFQKLPRSKISTGAMINLDGIKMFVNSVKKDGGVYKLIVGTHQI